jgi:hypothetical protein
MRLLFWAATPDAGPGWHPAFQGDAPVWQDLAARLDRNDLDDELRLPWRPPAMLWLVAALWNGDAATVWPLRLLFAALGALVAPLVWILLRRHLASAIAAPAAGLCAVATNLLLLGSGLHVEGVYLALVLVSLIDQPGLGASRPRRVAVRWGALHGLLCLLRAEHVLTFAALAVVAWRCGARWRTLALATAALGAVLLPWQLTAARLVDDYNAGSPRLPPLSLPWDATAVAAVRELPSFQQVPVLGFVDATVAARGGRRVTVQDLGVVREAYGVWPEPLPHPFIALYGGLNFFLANTPEADGGFSRAALDRPPPLLGGDERYPPGLRRVLPTRFAFSYPPHLDAVVHGHARGLAEIAADSAGALARCARKLWHAVEGATGGVGGAALPIGLSGVRRPVDFVTATGAWPAVWRSAVLALGLAGLWLLRGNRALWPLLAFATTKVLTVAMFFGYARQGALCLPALAVGVAAAVHALVAPRWPALLQPRTGLLLLAALLAAEVFRARGGAEATIDGLPVAGAEPFGAHDFTARAVEFR